MANIDKIIENNMGLVYKQLHRFHLVNDDEAYSLAMEALWQAVETFDVTKGFQFSTYASVCIYNAIGRYIRHKNRKRQLEIISYNAIVDDNDGDTEFEYFFGDLTDDPEKRVLLKELDVFIKQSISEEYFKLSGNSRIVIGAWIASDYKVKQGELAKATGIAQPTVSRILSAFKYKLKKRLEDYLC